MADTVLTELKIHEFDSVEQMSQYESEIGENDMVYTPDTSIRLPILTPMWFDHQVNDESWLNADTFSWQPSGKYKQTYEHLTADFETATTGYGWTGDTTGSVYITKGMPRVGDTVVGGGYTVGEVGSDYIAIYKNGVEYEYATRNSAYDGTADTSQTDAIGDITITYYQAKDGHKICLPDQESNLIALYEATGVAWYYLLDQTNQQFKLPRTKWGFTGIRDSVGSIAYTGTSGATPDYASAVEISSGWVAEYDCIGYCDITQSNNQSATVYVDGKTVYNFSGEDYPKRNGSQWFVPKGSTVTYSGSWVVKPKVYKLKTVYDKSPASQMHLYFWVGAFDQTATEQTAGLNAEMFNGKADRNLLNTTDNVDIVVESQLPTAENGYTWYRKYKSGWAEMGGSLSGRSITFPVAFVAIPTLVLSIESASDTAVYVNVYNNLTVTGFGGWRRGVNAGWMGERQDMDGCWTAQGVVA